MKTPLILLAVLSAAPILQAQGLFRASNGGLLTRISTNSWPGEGATGLTAAQPGLYDYAIFYSQTATTVLGSTKAQVPGGYGALGLALVLEDPNWTFAVYATNAGVAPGRLRPMTSDPTGLVAIPGVPGGDQVQFVVLGWSASIGSTLSDLEANLFSPMQDFWLGQSAVSGPITLGEGNLIATPNIFGPNYPALQGFTLGDAFAVPEPSGFLLLSVGLVVVISMGYAAKRHKMRKNETGTPTEIHGSPPQARCNGGSLAAAQPALSLAFRLPIFAPFRG